MNIKLRSNRKSDNGLAKQWYRITAGTQKLANTCAGWMSCGTLYPGTLE